MEIIKRDDYLKKLIQAQDNGLVKIITGIRRCGKSFLLNKIFYDYLVEKEKFPKDHIIKLALDVIQNKKYRNPEELYKYIKSQIKDKNKYIVMLDEIQLTEDFESVLNSLLYEKNIDIYVTGSNSKFLSKDIITQFRGRGYEIYVSPLSFSEFCENYQGEKAQALEEYMIYGGLPFLKNLKTEAEKSKYLKDLYKEVYIKDVLERNKIQKSEILENLLDILASTIGSLNNSKKLANTFQSKGMEVSSKTIENYIGYLEDAFLIYKAKRYNIKGKNYIDSPLKYYYSDLGLRNARINFRQTERDHLMENLIYNELILRGYNVDVGLVEKIEKNKENKSIRKQYEVDFVCNQASKRYYIQSAYSLLTEEKINQEKQSLINVNDSFKKIIIVADNVLPYYTEEGILIMGLIQFLLDKTSLSY